MPSPRNVLRVLVAFALLAILLPSARPAAALDAPTFIAKTYAWAQAEEREYGVPASVSIAQSMLESGMGESTLTKNANNWFGIKCSSTTSPYQNGCYSIKTTEYDANGTAYTTTASFRKYDTPEKSFIDHGYFLSSLSRYARAFDYTDNPDRFIVEVHKGGYATDPHYANKVISIMVKYDLYRYNITPPGTGPSELAIRPQTRAYIGAKAYVTGLLSPGGGGRAAWTQVLTPSGWSTSQRVTAGSRGQFSIELTYGADRVGVTRYRVQAASAAGTLTSTEFVIERLGHVKALPVDAVWVNETARLRGTAAGYAGRTVISQVLVNGSWQYHTTGTVASDGTFNLPLTYAQSSAGTRTFRARLTTPHGTVLVSNSVQATWSVPVSVSAYTAGTKAVGQDTNVWGTATGAPNSEVWTEVQLSTGWTRSQTGKTDGAGSYVIPLDYGKDEVSTYRWRVGVKTSLGVYYSNEVVLRRVAAPSVTASSAGSKPTGQDTNAWGTASGAPNSEVWTEIKLANGWSRSQTRTTDGAGAFVIPLTYGFTVPGTYTWRIAVRNSLGTFYSEEFTLTRVAAPVSVSAYSAGTKQVGVATNTWGTAAGASDAEVWTEVQLAAGWSRSQTGRTGAYGGFVLPLTYGASVPGTYTWRVGVRSPEGIFYSAPFTLTRVR